MAGVGTATITTLLVVAALGGCNMIVDTTRDPEIDCAKLQPSPPAWLVRSCVMRVSCSPYLPAKTIGGCIGAAEPLSTKRARCAKDAKTCADVAACNGYAPLADAACKDRPQGWSCAGDQAIRCGFGDPYYVDCAHHGGTCRLYAGAAKYSTWPCRLKATNTCSGEKTTWHCADNKTRICLPDGVYGRDCDAVQGTCHEYVDEGTPRAYCSSYSEPCTQPSGWKGCVGDTVVRCGSGGVGAVFDCSLIGGTCQYGRCRAKDCKVVVLGLAGPPCREKCLDDNRMQACVFPGSHDGGQRLTIDCRDHGLTTCAAGKLDGKPFTYCR